MMSTQSIGSYCASSQEVIDLRPTLIVTPYINTSTFMQAESAKKKRVRRNACGGFFFYLHLRWESYSTSLVLHATVATKPEK